MPKTNNVAKVPLHLNWGADRKTLTLLYKSLIQSKINYCLEIITPNKRCIEAINAIQNEALRIILGAFKSSPTKSLQVEAGIMPIHLQMALNCTKHFLRMQQATRSPTTQDTMQTVGINEEWTFKTQIQLLMGEEMAEGHLNVMEDIAQEVPPWRIKEANICDTIEMRKTSNPQESVMEFREHQEIHSEYIQVYTDGSRNEYGTGSAVVIPSMNLTDSLSLPKFASIFTAETMAIIMATKIIIQLPQEKYIIYTDSRSTLESLRQHDPRNPIIKKAKEWLHYSSQNKGKDIKLCWTPAHVGVPGNEQADAIAKRATAMVPRRMKLPLTDIIPIAKLKARREWQREWDEETNNKLHKSKPLHSVPIG